MDFFDFIQLKVKVSLLIHPLSARKQYRIRQLTERSEVSDPFVKIIIKKKRIIFLATMTKGTIALYV
jgi:hypothetical protein